MDDDLFDEPSDPSLVDGFVRVGYDEEYPIFSVERFDRLSPQRPGTLRHAAIAQKTLLVGTSACRLLRIDAGGEVEEVEVPKRRGEEAVRRVHMDPSGLHAIVTTTADEAFHLALPARKLRALPKLRGAGVESVGWSAQRPDEKGTHAILLGTAAGQLHEACLVDGRERYVKLVYDLKLRVPVCDIRVERFPTAGPAEDGLKLLVFVATPTRLYQFIGGPTFEALFALDAYATNPPFIELPGSLPFSAFQLFSKHGGRADSFAWLTQQGVHVGTLSFGSQKPGESAIADQELVPLAAAATPVGMVLLEWHALELLSDRLHAVNRLSHEVVWEHPLPAAVYGTPVAVARDGRTGAVWLVTDTGLWRVLVVDEERDMWLLHVKRGAFEAALQLCREAGQRDRVLAAQADAYFAEGRYELAAERFAKSSRPFEAVALQFLAAREPAALQKYLLFKLDSLRPSEGAQRLLVATWLAEIYLDRLNALSGEGRAEQLAMTADDFRHFLTDNREVLHPATTYQLLAAHGRTEELAFYAAAIGEHGRVVAHHVERGDHARALAALLAQSDPALYAKFAPDLLAAQPAATVNALIRAAAVVEPRDLLPALLRYDPARHNAPADPVHHAIRYLEHCVGARGSTDPALHDALLYLYAHLPDEAPLLRFLAPAADGAPARFDAQFALRLCARLGRRRACVQLHSALGQHERAVELALPLDLDMAKRLAANVREEDGSEATELRRRLWLKIARHTAQQTNDIRATMEVLRASGSVRVEDVLPCFADAAHIDEVKGEVVRTLEAHNARIAALHAQLLEASGAAGALRGDAARLAERVQVIPGERRCGECRGPLLAREFYLFPCGHAFHTDCLLRRVLPDLPRAEQHRVAQITHALAALHPAPAAPAPAPAAAPAPAPPPPVPPLSLPGTPAAGGPLSAAAAAGASTLATPRGRKGAAAGVQTPEGRSRASSPRRNSFSSAADAAALAASLALAAERAAGGRGPGAWEAGRGDATPRAAHGARGALTAALGALSLGLLGGGAGGARGGGLSGEAAGRAERLREELGEYVGRECVACGDFLIRTIDRPFIGPQDADELRRWEL